MTKMVFSDVDGTLLNSNHQITPLTESAIKGLKEKDIPFVIVSARSPSGIYPITREYGLTCPIIAYSGGLILDEGGKVLFHKGIKKEKTAEIVDYIEKEGFDLTWCLYSLDQWIVKDRKDPRVVREETIVKAQSEEGDVSTIVDAEVNKILCICNPERILEIEEKLKAKFPECSIVKSSPILLEIMENGITKATAIQRLCRLWHIPVEDTMAFGDNYNDQEMLQTVGKGYLMGNAPEELKAKICLRTADNDHDGIYQVLKDI